MDLTENKVAEIATEELQERAETIRDAVLPKSITAEQVGSLFCDLIEACANIRDALALFLDTNLTEITDDIDSRLSSADKAAKVAKKAAKRVLEAMDSFVEITPDEVQEVWDEVSGASATEEQQQTN